MHAAGPTDAFDLRTPCDVQVGQFARECQMFHLVGRLVKHVFEPAADTDFQKAEATQIARTLNAYLPVLKLQEEDHGFYCGAFAICCR
jgi:hypothetical protein